MSSKLIMDRVIRPLTKKHPEVAAEFKLMLMEGIESYRRHNTRAKLLRILTNLPLGAFLEQSDIDKLIGEEGKPPSYQELVDIVSGIDPQITVSIRGK